MSNKDITPAILTWDNAGNPYSEEYQDIYYSQADALAESSYIFLEGNHLTERWRKLAGKDFVIGECGFGGGLNFLNTCKLWCESEETNSILYYLASELNPFTKEDLERLHLQHPVLLPYAKHLLEVYPPLHAGIHNIEFNLKNKRIVLILMLGDAKTMLEHIWQSNGFRVDAWFLDGFSPALNANMWDENLCSIIASLSKAGATLSTYSAAGLIKNSLRQNGFTVQRKPGFAQKRHMLTGQYHTSNNEQKNLQQSWFQLPEKNNSDQRAIIIGGGLAGCSTAAELVKAGWQITLIEREPEIASKASGNPRGVVYCKISDDSEPSANYHLNAYLFAIQHYQQVAKNHSIDWQACGLLQMALDAREIKRQTRALEKFRDSYFIEYLDAQSASKLSGVALNKGGLFFPEGGFLNPHKLCQAYIQHDNINCIKNTEAINLKFENKNWLVETKQGTISRAPVVIIANSQDALSFEQTRHYPLLENFGQIDEYPMTEISKRLACIVCAKGYISPAHAKSHFIGGITKTEETLISNKTNIAKQNLDLIRDINHELTEEFKNLKAINSRTGSRCSSPDYLPIAGPVENEKNCRELYKSLSRNAKQKVSQTPDYETGLYINVAHGSHGLTSTPIIANYLARLINRSPLPLSNTGVNCLHPIRYLIRDLKKQRL